MLSTSKYSSNSNLFWFEITFVKFHKLHLCFPLQFSSCCLFRWVLLPARCQAVSGKVRLSVDSLWESQHQQGFGNCLYMLKVGWNKFLLRAWFGCQKAHVYALEYLEYQLQGWQVSHQVSPGGSWWCLCVDTYDRGFSGVGVALLASRISMSASGQS